MGIRSLGYVRLQAPDTAAWKVFGEDFLGLMRVEGDDPESVYFRLDHYPPRLVVSPGDEPAMTAMGFEVMHERDLAEVAAAVEREGIKVTAGTEAECAERRVNGFVRFQDPAGNPVELFYGPVLDHVRPWTPLVTSGFVTGDMGMGHVIVTAEDVAQEFDFYTRVLGFVERNTAGPTYFMGCNARHHTFGIAPRPGPGQLVHIMVEAGSLDDVGLALDRAADLDIPMMNTLGKHTNDHMVSFYVYSPEFYAIEFGWNGLRVEREEPTYEITEGAFWGHKFTPPPAP
ncbi:3,4-dihydroxy-9,10-secoandrosta-1,3,5(10)-triene-9,17-dione 4,5-dioxygenase [Actinocorallia herbida]|uniref:3,4-dihydroxy-9,10-secoandrosta-1,3, 5(10)-triene-9,17-dione 4,5-dioxygenase n=1 Tax=Actinocorallia herbida TaxID=58109 RepID=A0A3N1D376_9ACTN|nr:3,4-dihydroxy-9,10-secoandrosta-1,3,5(10)-triene-9,17-dione 4,5-dioxygenase [Actinocorallia herbida]